MIDFFQPDTYVYSAGESLDCIFNNLLKQHLPNFEDVLLRDSMEDWQH